MERNLSVIYMLTAPISSECGQHTWWSVKIPIYVLM